jgi:hypothetical protein
VAGAAELRLWDALLAAETGRVRLLDADEDELVASFDVDATEVVTARVVPEGEGARVVVEGGSADVADELKRRTAAAAAPVGAGPGPRASLAIGGALAAAIGALAIVVARRRGR